MILTSKQKLVLMQGEELIVKLRAHAVNVNKVNV